MARSHRGSIIDKLQVTIRAIRRFQMSRLAAAAISVLVFGFGATAAEESVSLPADEPTTVNGVELACTGIGDEAQSDPRWKAFPVRLEFAGGNAQYLADVDVSVSDSTGTQLFQVRCDSAWLLAKLSPGKYVVKGSFRNLVKSSKFTAPKSGQARVIVRFPEIVGSGDN
jgi:hypothetical protein